MTFIEVLDDFLPFDEAEALRAAWPSRRAWYVYDSPLERKLAWPHVHDLPEVFQDTFRRLIAPPFMRRLEKITGLRNLIADPSFRGGGLHCIRPGGHLDVHTDFNLHSETGWKRVLNLIVWLVDDDFDGGGDLELWDADMTRCVRRIAPVFNRCAIFRVDGIANHGHPDPLQGDKERRSMAVYYYQLADGDEERVSTQFKRRPGDSREHDALRERRGRQE